MLTRYDRAVASAFALCAFGFGGIVGACSARHVQSVDAPALPRGTPATLHVHNVMPVSLDVFVSRAGFADIFLGTLRPYQSDTFALAIPQGVAFTYRAANAVGWRYRAETYLIFIRSTPMVIDWVIRTPLGMRPPVKGAK